MVRYSPGSSGAAPAGGDRPAGGATIVRMVLVRAVMALFGARAWWIPGSLDRVLPRTGLEEAPAGQRT